MPYPLDPDRREIDLRHMIEGDKMKTAYLRVGINGLELSHQGSVIQVFSYNTKEMDYEVYWYGLKNAQREAEKWAKARGYTVEWQE